MKLEVPFYKQETRYDCGPTALRMVVDYLSQKQHSRDQLQDLVDSDKSGVTWTIGLAKSAAQLGFRTEFYTTCLGFNPKNYELEFYQKVADEASSTDQKLEKLKREAIEFKGNLQERK
ncbi:MAG: C39 family peptidase [Nanoarchaeota archaeon]